MSRRRPQPRLARLMLLLVVAIVAASAQSQAPANSWKPDIELAAPPYPFTFIGYGDIRFMDPADHQNSNPEARRAEVARIAREKPAFLLISGDLVFNGSDQDDWKVFDAETTAWREAKIEVLPALGNHDVRGDIKLALENYFQRFPRLMGRRWYSARAANVAIFVLDSDLPDAPGSEQCQWLEQGLAELPPEVDFVLVALHHPPITHSHDETIGGGHSVRPQEKELGALLEKYQQKMRARIIVLAGHVHNYERYERNGVTYLVSGGGGATPYMIRRSPHDFYRDPGPTYNICTFTVDHGTLRFKMLKLSLGHQPEWAVRDSFVLQAGELHAGASER